MPAAKKAAKSAAKSAKKPAAKSAKAAKPAAAKASPKTAKKSAPKAAKSTPAAEPAREPHVPRPARPHEPIKHHNDGLDAAAKHAHQDPSGSGAGVAPEPGKVSPQNYGEAKARRTPRLNKVGNFFRRGAFWRGKNPPGHG